MTKSVRDWGTVQLMDHFEHLVRSLAFEATGSAGTRRRRTRSNTLGPRNTHDLEAVAAGTQQVGCTSRSRFRPIGSVPGALVKVDHIGG